MKQIFGWTGGIIASVVIYWLTIGFPHPSKPPVVVPPPEPPGVMGGLMTNINLLGNDISNGEVAANAEECQSRCSFDKSCLAMTYEIVSASSGRCWMKNAVPAQSNNSRSISSIKKKFGG